MQVEVIGGICFLAFLLSLGRADELEGLKEKSDIKDDEDPKDINDLKETRKSDTSNDLRSGINSLAIESNSQEDVERSAALAHHSSHNFGGSSVSNAVAHSQGTGSSSAYATAEASQGSPFNPYNPQLIPFGSGLSPAEAQAISESQNSFNQGQNSYPYSSSYPFNSGSNSAQPKVEFDNGIYQPASIDSPILNPYNIGITSPQALAQAENGFYQPAPIVTPLKNGSSPFQADKGFYQPAPIAAPILSPYNQGLNSAQSQGQVNNGFYQSEANLNPYELSSSQAQGDNGLYPQGYLPSPNFSPNNKGSSSAQAQGQVDSESYQPNSIPTHPVQRLNPVSHSPYYFPSYPYSEETSSTQAQARVNSGPYQPIPIPNPNFSPYDRFLVPYKESSFAQEQSDSYQADQGSNFSSSVSSPRPKIFNHKSTLAPGQPKSFVYQPIPIPDLNPSPYDSLMVPYKEPSSTQTKDYNEKYLSIPILKPNPKQYGPGPISKPYSGSPNIASTLSSSQLYGLRMNSSQTQSLSMKYTPYQSIPIPDLNPSPYDSLMVPYREPNSDKVKSQIESDPYEPIPIPYDPKSDPLSSNLNNIIRSGKYDPDDDDVDLKSKSGWDSYEYNPNPPSGPNPQLYPSGADPAVQVFVAGKRGDNDVNRYIQEISPYVNDYNYPSEPPYRQGGLYQSENEGPPDVFASGQSSQISFEDAKSRVISPHEYIFPNKMPGGENVVQCLKENEFHHFWSQAVDCLVCICLNDYGLLTPVCASCGGCHNPPPKLSEPYPRLPEPITTRPASPEPFEPLLVIEPEPSPPEPIPPIPEPFQPYPNPEPYPVYPEPIPEPSPVPETFPEPTPTLPPLPPEATCNPLPSGQPFTNPLHPCQICVCRESYVSGKPDVQIQCKENPQCIAPADVTTLPPLPDVPVPIPLPMCEKFPEHVLFPHPTDACRLCKCAKSVSEAGIPEQQITCYPHPDCVPKLEPVTEPEELPPPPPVPIEPYQPKPLPEPPVPIPAEPLREPYQPMEPVPLPEIVTVEPLPWPPITTIAPVPTPVPTLPVLTPRPGPLPGPSPHESCRPYPPNQAFQHPWDECQICLCTEAFAVGMITVEVNCYTKPSCCIEPPDSVKSAIPGYSKTYPGIINPVISPDVPVLPSGPTGVAITSTYRPPSVYSSYSPRSLSIYPANQGAGADALTSQFSPGTFSRVKPDDAFANPQSSYPYQPNYHPGYVNQQYSDYPPRLPSPPAPVGQYKPSNYGYPGNYQYAQDNPIGNAYPGPQGVYQPYDPRYQGVQAPNVYPPIYQRNNYEIPSMYSPGQVRDSYAQNQASANGLNSVKSYTRSKTGNDGSDDIVDESR